MEDHQPSPGPDGPAPAGSSRAGEAAFTLIELMVVVLVIAVLLAIAIPTFLGSRKRADDRSAQSSLRLSVSAARVKYTDGQGYGGATSDAMATLEPSLTYKKYNEESTGPKEVSVKALSADTWYAAAKSKSGKCYYVQDSVNGGGTSFAEAASGSTPCTAHEAGLLDASNWRARW